VAFLEDFRRRKLTISNRVAGQDVTCTHHLASPRSLWPLV
jgi:hypothetical protein